MFSLNFSALIKYVLWSALAYSLCTSLANAQTPTATVSIQKNQSECVDFLEQLNKKPPNLVFEDCTVDTKQGSDVFTANYKVAGQYASAVEAYFVKTAGMPKMRRVCCIWESLSANNVKRKTNHGLLRANKKMYEISMGSETSVSQRSQWSSVPSFDVTVTWYRDEP
jgi:hypothetical protein